MPLAFSYGAEKTADGVTVVRRWWWWTKWSQSAAADSAVGQSFAHKGRDFGVTGVRSCRWSSRIVPKKQRTWWS